MTATGKVVAGYCIGPDVTREFHRSLVDLLMYDVAGSRRLQDGGGLLDWESGVNVASARNAICEKFLKESGAEWLWMLDTDMDFRPDTLDRLLVEADEDKAPIVGALCFGIDKGLYFPTLYDMAGTPEWPEFVRYDTWAPDSMMQVFATGAACLLIHRSALLRVQNFQNPDRPGQTGFSQAFPWFQETDFYGRCMGEDITFCLRAGFTGLPVFVNTAVQVGHVKRHTLTMDGYLGQRGYLAPTHPGVPA
jgi:hypothetical protein